MDPITIGLAFTAAQSAVSHIKQAIALGKDVNSLVGQFGKFFESADTIHRAKTKNKLKAMYQGKSDAELGQLAMQTAMHSDALREAERQLKDMIIWELGKPQIWDDMIKERTRLFKERAAAEKAEEERQLAHKKKIANAIMTAMYFVGFSICAFCIIMGGVGVYGAMEEKRMYEEKIAKAQAIRVQQQKARELEAKKELADYAKN
jgi:hypothetical protein